MDRLLLVASTFCFLLGFAHSMHALGARVYRRSRLNFFAILGGFTFQTAFLWVRGQEIGRCPLTNLFEVFIFLAWAMVLFYLLIGPTYRLSLLGVFTSPLVFVLQVSALLIPGLDRPPGPKIAPNPWMELHAASSIVAYGAFALAGVAGLMYLVQEKQLKTHHLRSIFFHLPPIRDLAVANRGLILTGFALLTVGIGAGFAVGSISSHAVKVAWSVGVWSLYGFILVAEFGHRMSPRRGAWLSVVALGVVLSTLWGIRFITDQNSV
jgi:HemX protein